jgi:hypothetical protein
MYRAGAGGVNEFAFESQAHSDPAKKRGAPRFRTAPLRFEMGLASISEVYEGVCTGFGSAQM